MRLDLVGDEGVAKIGARLEAAELILWIVEENGKENLAFVGGDQRPVVGDELGEQRSDEQDQKDPKRPRAALVAAEIVEPPLIHRREPGTPLQARARFRPLPRVRLFVERKDAVDLVSVFGRRVGWRSQAVRIDQAHTSRVSKSMRGSIQV